MWIASSLVSLASFKNKRRRNDSPELEDGAAKPSRRCIQDLAPSSFSHRQNHKRKMQAASPAQTSACFNALRISSSATLNIPKGTSILNLSTAAPSDDVSP